MSSKREHLHHVPDNAVVERRLRPIYDWLDNGNNKKALQECDKVLKKTPNLHCAKALKALTLHRMGKESDAITILDALTTENPTDDATLQAMSLCYRELQKLEKICKLYETAIKFEPNNEELLTHLFMSYTRIYNFKLQQQIAMQLYKLKQKSPYYCWAIMSIILQAKRGEGKYDINKRKLLLSLAERMMLKLINDINKFDSTAEQEIQLLLMIYELQLKFQDCLLLLNNEKFIDKLLCTNTPQLRLKYLINLNKWNDINLLCKTTLVGNIDRWDIWKEYIKSVFELFKTTNQTNNNNSIVNNSENNIDCELNTIDDTPEKCHEFICRIIENGAKNTYMLRGPYLARFELLKFLQLNSHENNALVGERTELFLEYYYKFGNKSCCVNDLRLYTDLLTKDEKLKFSKKLLKNYENFNNIKIDTLDEMQKHLCALKLARFCGYFTNNNDMETMIIINELIKNYDNGLKNFEKNFLITDLYLYDYYIILATHFLYDLYKLLNRNEPIIYGLILLENLLKTSPNNFHAKLLIIKFYLLLGGNLGAHKWYLSLDLKHLQLDSLGFIYCQRLPTFGFFSIATNVFDVISKFFSSNYRDSCDHLTFSYKYGSFIKLDEFMDFRERLDNSIHYLTVAFDRILLNFMECTNIDNILQMDFTPKNNNFEIEWENLRDNHDWNVYVNWDSIRKEENFNEIEKFFQQTKGFLKLRYFLILTINKTVEIINQTNERDILLEQLNLLINEWELFNNKLKTNGLNIKIKENLFLPLPSRLHLFIKLPYFEICGNLLKMFNCLLLNNNNNNSEIFELIENSLKNLNFELKFDKLENCREMLELIINCVEIYGICTQILLIFNEYINKNNKLLKKNWKNYLNKLINLFKFSIENFLTLLNNWRFNYDCELNDLLKMFKNFNCSNNKLIILLNNSSDCEKLVKDYINNSYLFALKEIDAILKGKVKMLNNLVC